MAAEIHVGDVGTIFRYTVKDAGVAVDVSSATTLTFLFKTPSGSVIERTASFQTDGTDGVVEYATVAGDLTEAGEWNIQLYVVLTSWTGHTDLETFQVYENLS